MQTWQAVFYIIAVVLMAVAAIGLPVIAAL